MALTTGLGGGGGETDGMATTVAAGAEDAGDAGDAGASSVSGAPPCRFRAPASASAPQRSSRRMNLVVCPSRCVCGDALGFLPAPAAPARSVFARRSPQNVRVNPPKWLRWTASGRCFACLLGVCAHKAAADGLVETLWCTQISW